MTASTLPDKAAVLAAFKDTPEGRVVVHAFDKLGSTSGWLGARRSKVQTQLENGCAEICVTDWQQAGVGRRGKTWQTRPGNITFSLLQRLHSPAQNLLGLSLVTGIAVSDVLEETLGLKAMLKWPNDVIHQDRKLGGLLTELVAGNGERAEARPFTDVITGIGLNVFHDDAVSAMGLGATSLHAAGCEIDQHERDKIVGRIAACVMDLHKVFVDEGWAAVQESWVKRDWLVNKPVSVVSMNRVRCLLRVLEHFLRCTAAMYQ